MKSIESMASDLDIDVVAPGTTISFYRTDGPAVAGLEKKGLVVKHTNKVEITPLGTAWFKTWPKLGLQADNGKGI